MKGYNKDIGGLCEKLALDYLIREHYIILELNYKTRLGEIDMICTKDNLITIIEVKGRYNLNYGYPRECVHFSKQKTIINVTKSYLSKNKLNNYNIRFDVIEIFLNAYNSSCRINHIKDAFRIS